MGLLKYTIIKKRKQYDDYCNILEELVNNSKADLDEIELLDLLIEKWDSEHNSFNDLDPVTLIKALMEENKLKAKDLVVILDLSKGSISKILNYHKGLSKETIRKLSIYFSVSQELFNRSYNLVNQRNKQFEMVGS
jgi:HTH-type transcriptional regulator/antitoxin HigA